LHGAGHIQVDVTKIPHAGNSSDGHHEEGRDSGPWGDNASLGNEENSYTKPQYSTLKDNTQTEALHGAGHVYVDATKIPQAERKSPAKVSSQINEAMSVQGALGSDLKGVHGTIPTGKIYKTELQHGNSIMNLNRSLNESRNAVYMSDSTVHDQLHAALGSQLSASLGPIHVTEDGMNKGTEGGDLGGMITPGVTALKRSKQREGSANEDSSSQAERLKVQRNLDGLGMLTSKSFLAFSDSKVVKNIALLGVSLGKNVANSIACLKENEHERLVQAASCEPNQVESGISHDGEVSDIDSDLGLDQFTIKHLVVDIVEDILGQKKLNRVTLNLSYGNLNQVHQKR
jgi:hypothetical protein